MRSQRLSSTRDVRSKLPPVVPAIVAGDQHAWVGSLSKLNPRQPSVSLSQINQLLHDRDAEPRTAQQLRALAKRRVFDSHNSISSHKTENPTEASKSRVQLTPITRQSSTPDTSRTRDQEIEMNPKELASIVAQVEASSNQMQHLEQRPLSQIKQTKVQSPKPPVRNVSPPKAPQSDSWQAGSTTLARYRRLVGTVGRRNLVVILDSAARQVANRRKRERQAVSLMQGRARIFLVHLRGCKKRQRSATILQRWVRRVQQHRREIKRMEEEQERCRVKEQNRLRHKAVRAIQTVYWAWRSEQQLQQEKEAALQQQQIRARQVLCVLLRKWKQRYAEATSAIGHEVREIEQDNLASDDVEEMQLIAVPSVPPIPSYHTYQASRLVVEEDAGVDDKMSRPPFVSDQCEPKELTTSGSLLVGELDSFVDHTDRTDTITPEAVQADMITRLNHISDSVAEYFLQADVDGYQKAYPAEIPSFDSWERIPRALLPSVGQRNLDVEKNPCELSSRGSEGFDVQPVCMPANPTSELSISVDKFLTPIVSTLTHSDELHTINRFLLGVAYRRRGQRANAAIRLQRFIRRFLKRMLARYIVATIKLQLTFRGHLARRRLREELYAELVDLRAALANSWNADTFNDCPHQSSHNNDLASDIYGCTDDSSDDDEEGSNRLSAPEREQELECAFLPSRNGQLPPGVRIGRTGTQADGRGLLTMWWWNWQSEKWISNAPASIGSKK